MAIIEYNSKIEHLRELKKTCKPLLLQQYMTLKEQQQDMNCVIENNKMIMSILVFPFLITFYFFTLDFLDKLYNNFKNSTEDIVQYIKDNSSSPNLITEVSQKVDSATQIVDNNKYILACVLILITIISLVILYKTIQKSKIKNSLDKEIIMYEYIINEQINSKESLIIEDDSNCINNLDIINSKIDSYGSDLHNISSKLSMLSSKDQNSIINNINLFDKKNNKRRKYPMSRMK